MSKTCKAPEAIPGILQEVIDVFGDKIDVVAENMIFEDYVRTEAINEFTSIFPKRNFDGAQVFRDVTGLNTQLWIAYVVDNNSGNPKVKVPTFANLATMPDAGIKNPDWALDRKARNEFEFYEVKPNSNSGLSKGRDKIRSVSAFCGTFGLPYNAGIFYQPDEMQNLWFNRQGFIETEVTLHWFRREPGLILYEICIERRARNPLPSPVAKAVNETLNMLLIIGALSGDGIPIPVP
jgi:hypothetical protein